MEEEAIVVDMGTWGVRAGIAGDDEPKLVFRTLVEQRERRVGPEAVKAAIEGVEAVYPLDHGMVRDWGAVERIYEHIFAKLRRDPKGSVVMQSEPLVETEENRTKAGELLFETFEIGAFHRAPSGVLALYSSGRTTGVTLNIGEGLTEVCPLYEGMMYEPMARSIHLAGSEISNLFAKRLLLDQGVAHDPQVAFELGALIKESLGYVALDYQAEKEKDVRKDFTLPDGRVLEVGEERFALSEALFNPALHGIGTLGIQNFVLDTIRGCPIDSRRDLFSNIVLCGGTSKLAGLADRLQKEVQSGAPASVRCRISHVHHEAYSHGPWLGGSILASLTAFSSIFITRQEYEEHGPSIFSASNKRRSFANGSYEPEEVLL